MDMRRLQGDVCFNFSIYDELFDSSLDARGIELVIGVLKERVDKYNESIMVISHRKESVKAATGDVIFLEKSNGITRRVDYVDLAA
jgi:ABC-type Mn2+/Zn2+ transport system ATPase subunit